jgi:hypothetical protein
VENAQASLRDTQAREQAGVGTRFDVLQAQVNLANAQQELTIAVPTQMRYKIISQCVGAIHELPLQVYLT